MKKRNFWHKKGAAVASLGVCAVLGASFGLAALRTTDASAAENVVPTSTSVAVTSVFQARTSDGSLIGSDAPMRTRTHLAKHSQYYMAALGSYFVPSALDAIDPALAGNGIMATLIGTNSTDTTLHNKLQTSTYLDLSDNTENDVLFKMDLAAMFGGSVNNGMWDQFTYHIKLTDDTKSVSLVYVPAHAGELAGAGMGWQPVSFGCGDDTVTWPNQPTTTQAGLYVKADNQKKLGGLLNDGTTFSGLAADGSSISDGYGTPIPAFTKYNYGTQSGHQHCSSYDANKQVLYYDNEEMAIYADVVTADGVKRQLVRDLDATDSTNGGDAAWGGFANPERVRIEVTQKSTKGSVSGKNANQHSFIVHTLDGVSLDYDETFVGSGNCISKVDSVNVDKTGLADDESVLLQADSYQLNVDGSFAGSSAYKNEGKTWYTTRGVETSVPNTFINKTTGASVALEVVGAYLEADDGTQTMAADGKITVPDDGKSYEIVVFGREAGAKSTAPMHFTRRAVAEQTYISSVNATSIFTITDNSGNAPTSTEKTHTKNLDSIQVGTFANIALYERGNWIWTVDGAYDAYWTGNGLSYLKEAYQGKTLFIPLSHIGDGVTTAHVAKSLALDLSDNTANDAVLDIDLAAYFQNNPMQRYAINGMYRIRLTDGIKYVDLYYRAAKASTAGTTYLPTDTKEGITGSWSAVSQDTTAGEVFVLTSDSTAVGSAIAVPAFTKDVSGVPMTTLATAENRQKIYYDAATGTLSVLGKDGAQQTALTGWSFADPSSVSIEISYKDTKGANSYITYSCIAHGIDGMDIAYESNDNPILTGSYKARKDGTFAGKSTLEATGAVIEAMQDVGVDVLTKAAIEGYTVEKTAIEGKAATNNMVFDTVGDYTLTVWATKNGGADDIVYMQKRIVRVEENTTMYTVTYDANGIAAENMPQSAQVQHGNKITEPSTVPTSATKNFIGWYDKDGKEWSFDTGVVKGNVTLYAKWEDKVMVSFNLNGAEGTIDAVEVDADGKVNAPTEPTRTHYTFGGWYKEAECENVWSFASDTTAESLTLYAKWTKKTYTVTFDTDEGSAIAPVTVEGGNAVAKPETDPTKEGYTFAGWYVGDVEYDFNTILTDNITITAHWNVVVPETYVTGTSMDVSDSFILKVYLKDNLNVTYQINGGADLTANAQSNGNDETSPFFVEIPLAPKQITDTITLKAGTNGAVYTTSALSYLDSVISSGDDMANIAKGLIVYADYAQRQFNYEGNGYATEKTVNGEAVAATKTAISEQSAPTGYTATATPNNVTEPGYAGITLQLNEKLNLMVVFDNWNEFTVENAAYTVDTTTYEGVAVVVIDGINFGGLDARCDVVVKDASDGTVVTVTCTALAYIQGNWNSTNANLQGLCQSLYYVYGLANA